MRELTTSLRQLLVVRVTTTAPPWGLAVGEQKRTCYFLLALLIQRYTSLTIVDALPWYSLPRGSNTQIFAFRWSYFTLIGSSAS